MNVLVRFYWNCGRMGDVEGLFVAAKSDLELAYGKDVYLGEILGKHSEIYGTLNEADITILSEDQEFIDKLSQVVGSGTISGYNPLDYINEEE